MVYCAKCGQENPDEAQFCSRCGAPLMAARRPPGRDWGKDWEESCERECQGPGRGSALFWGIIAILIGVVIIFEVVLKNIEGMPDWVYSFEWWWLIALVVAIAIIAAGLRMIIRRA